ncbi:hypothetical protein BOX15_Mlig005944g2 [Macrostomum lignano]|uniref:C2 domain-containing protein n=1 Tax=Macrostomum lignano TaxID=282301 RepID=A0A267DT16_9PLAT|nr:hypothetical protein BOX15_Mlig005944g3 [Macrostomum lignano]PAA52451.1 hypothetical protein BOX15_Mlig005944g2 [Macrostomum lignano]
MSGFRALSAGIGSGVFQMPGARLDEQDEDGEDASPMATTRSSGAAAGSAWITPKKYSPTHQMKSRALGQLDPSLYLNEDAEELYEHAPGHVGRLWFVLNYTLEVEQLAVTVRKARNLRVRKEASSGQPGDCYVRLAMENDDRRVHTTSVKKKTNNPNFDEKFCFQIATASLESQTLLMTVFHVDKQKRQKAIGHVAYPLRELLSVDKDCRIFRDLDSEAGDTSQNPEVKIGLTYHAQLERITVVLHECRNLPTKSDTDECIEVYLRVSMHTGLQGKEVKSKRTETVGHSSAFNQSLIFNRVADLSQTIIKVTMMHHATGIGSLFDKPLGSVVLGCELFAKRRELEHWREMSANPEQTITYWHSLCAAAV